MFSSATRNSTSFRFGSTPAFAHWPRSELFTRDGFMYPTPIWSAEYPSTSGVRACTTWAFWTSSTVSGTRNPCTSHPGSIPHFIATRPVRRGSVEQLRASVGRASSPARSIFAGQNRRSPITGKLIQ
jgi:hypothetical protein